MRRVVLIGPPGAGKGTQGGRLAARWGVPHIASGAILRNLIASEDSPLARAARVIHEGRMIPDDVANAIAFRELDRPAAAQGFVLDGYPRDVAQAEALEIYLDSRDRTLDAVVALSIDEDDLVARLAGRLTCPNCGETYHVTADPPRIAGICDRCGHALIVREDDQADRIRTRLAVYHQRTEPLRAFYQARDLLRVVDAKGTETAVFARVLHAVA